MSITGRVTNGVVVLPPGTVLPEGSDVKVELQQVAADDSFEAVVQRIVKERADRENAPECASLPDDLAQNLDYYLHGHTRKQQPRQGRWIAAAPSGTELTEHETECEADQLRSMAAETTGLPADLSTNHNHYLYGLPKQ